MANMVSAKKKIALLHRYPEHCIKETNASFPYLQEKGIDVLTFKKFDRLSGGMKFWKSLAWVFYAPLLVLGKGYDVIYCDDSYPFYPALVKLASPRSKIVIRLGDLHLMYYYSGWVYDFLHFFEKMAWRMMDKIIVISDAMADYVEAETGDRPEIALDPVDPKDFHLIGAKSHGTVMFHGVLTKNKGVDILLEAAKKLPAVYFVILGDGPDRKRLENLAPSNVFFKGWVAFEKIKWVINTCAVGVALRSDNPGNEYVVTSPFLQYGIMGKPCLVTRRKVFGDYEWQFSGVDEFIAKLKYLLEYPQDKQGEKLREYILANHRADKIGEQIWQILT